MSNEPEEKVYQFNEYVLGYDKGENDRSCLTISKTQNDILYVMGTLYDGCADIISLMLESMQQEIKTLNILLNQADNKNLELIEMINKIEDIIENKNITGIEAKLMIQEILEDEK
jgi:Asp-tRNA(Asn)/Glu-tRNA(Gln) amidotransferase B subunit